MFNLKLKPFAFEPTLSNKALVAGSLFLIILSVPIGFYLISKPQAPMNLLISNTKGDSFTISYVTKKPVSNLVLISAENRFPPFPFLSKISYKDIRDDKKISIYTTHLIPIDNLQPDKNYYFRIYEGIKAVKSGNIKTPLASNISPDQNIISGKVVTTDKKTPVSGAIVYFQAFFEKEKSQILSTLTNQRGQWEFNLSNLQSLDLKNPFTIKNGVKQQIIVDGASLGVIKTSTFSGKLKDWPVVVLRKK